MRTQHYLSSVGHVANILMVIKLTANVYDHTRTLEKTRPLITSYVRQSHVFGKHWTLLTKFGAKYEAQYYEQH